MFDFRIVYNILLLFVVFKGFLNNVYIMVVFDFVAPPDMSVSINQSQNYIWRTDIDYLGEGSFGRVYRGIHKISGNKVAVKTFKHVTQQVSQEAKLLQTLQHDYIIRLLAIEVDEYNKNTVMILELSTGGSLMDFLNEPDNVCGLEDDEFLLVAKHLSGGLEYLKRHNVIHRDVKPDNIMRHFLDDGRTIYKLTDFGSARELPEGHNYQSIHGTAPYLNPQLYKAWHSRTNEYNGRFGAETDLWSIGVTLYQTGTGNLPFLVRDRDVMFMIHDTMRQNEKIISAIQQKNSKEVDFETKLPMTSRLSLGLKQLITPIIVGLFIQDRDRQWCFGQYHQQIVELLSRTVIKVFYINKMQMLNIYLNQDESFQEFKSHVSQQTTINEANQVYLYKQNLIVQHFENFPNVDSECVFLFDRSDTNIIHTNKYDCNLIFESLANFATHFMSDEGDGRLAYVACRKLSSCKYFMNYQSVVSFCTKFIEDFRIYCQEQVKELYTVYKMLMDTYSDTTKRVKILETLQDLNESCDSTFIQEFETKTGNFVDQASKLFNNLADVKTEINVNASLDLYQKIVTKELSDMNHSIKQLNPGLNIKIYDYEKLKIVHSVQNVLEILRDKMKPSFNIFVEEMNLWYESEFFSHLGILRNLKTLLHHYKLDMKNFGGKIHTRSENNLTMIVNTRKSFFNKQKLLDILSKYKNNSIDIKAILEENLQLIEKMNELVLSLDTNLSTDV